MFAHFQQPLPFFLSVTSLYLYLLIDPFPLVGKERITPALLLDSGLWDCPLHQGLTHMESGVWMCKPINELQRREGRPTPTPIRCGLLKGRSTSQSGLWFLVPSIAPDK